MKMPMSVYKYMSMPRYMVLTKINIYRRKEKKKVIPENIRESFDYINVEF